MVVKLIRWLGLAALGLVAVALLSAGVLYDLGGRKLARVHDVQGKAISTAVGDGAVARGEHLVRSVSGCADCHGADLGRKLLIEEPGFATLDAPNLTTGRGGAASIYSDADWERALRKGADRGGRALAPMIPSEATQHYSDADLSAVVAYLRSVPPVDRTTPEPEYSPLARVVIGAGVLPLAPDLVAKTDRLEPTPAVAVSTDYGHYLAHIAGCSTCHSADLAGAEHPAHPGLQTPNLSSGDAAAWSLGEFRQALRAGRTPEGRALSPDLMPWPMYAGMTDAETEALYLHLKSLSSAPRAD